MTTGAKIEQILQRLEAIENKLDQILNMSESDENKMVTQKPAMKMFSDANNKRAEFATLGESLIETDEFGVLRVVSDNKTSGGEV